MEIVVSAVTQEALQRISSYTGTPQRKILERIVNQELQATEMLCRSIETGLRSEEPATLEVQVLKYVAQGHRARTIVPTFFGGDWEAALKAIKDFKVWNGTGRTKYSTGEKPFWALFNGLQKGVNIRRKKA